MSSWCEGPTFALHSQWCDPSQSPQALGESPYPLHKMIL